MECPTFAYRCEPSYMGGIWLPLTFVSFPAFYIGSIESDSIQMQPASPRTYPPLKSQLRMSMFPGLFADGECSPIECSKPDEGQFNLVVNPAAPDISLPSCCPYCLPSCSKVSVVCTYTACNPLPCVCAPDMLVHFEWDGSMVCVKKDKCPPQSTISTIAEACSAVECDQDSECAVVINNFSECSNLEKDVTGLDLDLALDDGEQHV
uniref:Uncharacterized protein n=1 Tax=Ditylenchus dipsaci TaxID=166011 RepID=A0A915D0C5_9BILA